MNLNKNSGRYARLPDHYFIMEKRAKDNMRGGGINYNLKTQIRDRSYVNKRDYIFGGGHNYNTRLSGKAQYSGLPDKPRRRKKQQPQAAASSATNIAPPPPSLPTTSTPGIFSSNFTAPPPFLPPIPRTAPTVRAQDTWRPRPLPLALPWYPPPPPAPPLPAARMPHQIFVPQSTIVPGSPADDMFRRTFAARNPRSLPLALPWHTTPPQPPPPQIKQQAPPQPPATQAKQQASPPQTKQQAKQQAPTFLSRVTGIFTNWGRKTAPTAPPTVAAAAAVVAKQVANNIQQAPPQAKQQQQQQPLISPDLARIISKVRIPSPVTAPRTKQQATSLVTAPQAKQQTTSPVTAPQTKQQANVRFTEEALGIIDAEDNLQKARDVVEKAKALKKPTTAKEMANIQRLMTRALAGKNRADREMDEYSRKKDEPFNATKTNKFRLWYMAKQQYEIAIIILERLETEWEVDGFENDGTTPEKEEKPQKPTTLLDLKKEKLQLEMEKLKSAQASLKSEDARKQAAHEQKMKELENEGVAKRDKANREKWDNLMLQISTAPPRPVKNGVLEEFSRWDPINNPINSVYNNNYYNNYRPMTMENRLEQTVPPYDLPKNYPIYGGNGYYNYTNSYQPNMPSAVSMNFGRKGRTGRRTNWEKYGTPSLRTARDMIRSGVLPPGYEGLRGNPASSYVSSYKPYPLPVTNAPTVDQGGYAANYTDPGPLDALARGASAMLYGTRQFTSTPNQLFPTTIRNTTSTLPGNAYRMAGLVDSMRGQPLSNAERLSNIRNYAEAAKLINDDATGFTPEQRTTAMNAVAAALPIAATAATGGWGALASGLSTGLKAIGWMGENFWPLHDSYQRFKTRRNIYNAVDKVAGFFTGRGLKRRRRRGKKHFRKGSGLHTRKLKFGGMIIPPKKLKKMFSNNKECNCKNN